MYPVACLSGQWLRVKHIQAGEGFLELSMVIRGLESDRILSMTEDSRGFYASMYYHLDDILIVLVL